ncbi:polysaccharide lyase, partial [Candidatus Bathyarchaeota archaeon]|nr:polysaccharide lyase [Candidatus Bathyarchaeota archaeon]
IFSGWSGALTGTTNPTSITMNGDKTVTATFTEPSAHLFEDGFESGNFALWNGQDTGASISTVNPLQGTYHLRSSLTSGANNLWGGIYKSISGTNPVYLGALVDFNAPPNTDNEDQWVLCFSQSTAGNALAYAGLRRVSGTNYWAIWYLSAGTTLTYQISSIAFVDGWHDLELAIYRGTSSNGWVEFRVDGVLVCSAHNLSNSGRTLSYARVGFSYSDAQSATSSTVDIDNVTIDSDVAPPMLYNVNMLSSGASTNNLGSITFDGTNYTLPNSISKATGSYSISFTPSLGYVFDHWATTGSVSVAYPNAQSTTITVGGIGSLETVYSLAPIPVHLFADGFESGGFIAWSGTSITTGSSATVGSAKPHNGMYSAQFNVTSGSGTSARRAYSSVSGLSLAEVNASAYVYIAYGLPLTSGQNMWLIQFVDPSGNALASFGMRADASGTHWAVQSGNYPYAMAASAVPTPSNGQWYLLEAYYTHSATGKTLILSVNGVEVVSLAQNTSAANNVATVRVGIDYYVTSTSAMIYVDDVTIDN